MASDQDLALVTEAEAIARAEAMRVAYERAADLAGQALRAYVVGVIFLQDVRLVRWPDGRWVAGQRLADHAGRHDPKYWDHLASGATLADAHAAAWRILAPGAGVLEQLAADKALDKALGPGWRK